MDRMRQPAEPRTHALAAKIISAAGRVHAELGPGLLENVYEVCLAHEIGKRGLLVQRQCPVPVEYDGVSLGVAMRLDLLVERSVIVEVKAVRRLLPVHRAQTRTYLRLTGCRLGLLMNFHVLRLEDGIRRVTL